MTAFVTYHGSETLEDTFRRSDGDECGYQIPVDLIDRRTYIRDHTGTLIKVAQ